ncbi:MAG: bifunctional precorrin-2 dehydrogenase/sirohydrochlorin ferrochelatase [Candidatus Brocadiia bacterium]
MSRYFPINLSLHGCECLVVGGGPVACRKARAALACEAHVTVVSPAFSPQVAQLEGVRLVQRGFVEDDVEGATLVFAASSDPDVNRLVARAGRRRGVLVNVADTPEQCDFILPATVARGSLVISFSTGGAAPALARRLRRQFEQQVPQDYARYVALLGQLRPRVLEQVADPAARRDIFRQLADEPAYQLFAEQGAEALRALARRLVAEAP